MSTTTVALILLAIFLIILFSGTPIGISLAAICFIAGFVVDSLPVTPTYVYRLIISAFDNYVILAVPMFVFSGVLMARGGISKRLFNFFAFFIGKVPAGMPMCVVVTCLFYGAISGSAPATVAAVGAMTIPILVNLGYDRLFAVSLVVVAGGLGVIIPPSIPFVLYGLASNESIGDMFLAGVLPGILIALFLMAYCFIYCKRHGEDRQLIDANYKELRSKGLWKIFKESFWALLTPVIILGGIYGGIATPTEVSAISVVYAAVVSIFVYKDLKISEIPACLKESIASTAPAMLVVGMAVVFGKILALMQVPQMVATGLTSAFSNRIAIILVINLILLIAGMLMDTVSCIMILTPIFVPIAQAIDMNLVHLGIIMVVNLAIGFVTPPVGANLYVGSSMTGIPVLSIARKAIPLLIAFFFALLFITFVPELSLALLG